MKLFVAAFCALFATNFAYAQEHTKDCSCEQNPYVTYELNQPVEMDENPWRVHSVQPFDIDLTQVDEPAVCVVTLVLIPTTNPILYIDFLEVPENDRELLWNERWVLMSEFENQMAASACDIAGAQS
jgi:hypothetical protein